MEDRELSACGIHTPDSHQMLRPCENVAHFFIFYGHYHYLRGLQHLRPSYIFPEAPNEAAFPFPFPFPLPMWLFGWVLYTPYTIPSTPRQPKGSLDSVTNDVLPHKLISTVLGKWGSSACQRLFLCDWDCHCAAIASHCWLLNVTCYQLPVASCQLTVAAKLATVAVGSGAWGVGSSHKWGTFPTKCSYQNRCVARGRHLRGTWRPHLVENLIAAPDTRQ